jgi:hypothetical protein
MAGTRPGPRMKAEEAKADGTDNFGCGQGKVYWRLQLASAELYLLILSPHYTQD